MKTSITIYMDNSEKIEIGYVNNNDLEIFKNGLSEEGDRMTINDMYIIFKSHISFITYLKGELKNENNK